jgi:RimJ/RimL family protein N-acetyltransferase
MIPTDLSKYSAIEKLRNGRVIEIRALRPDDRDELLRTVDRASTESLQRRFFSPRRTFSEKEINRFFDVDFVNQVALAVIVDESGRPVIAGGCRYILIGPGRAEVAFGLEDKFQGQGIASAMLRHLIAIASSAGIEEFHADVLPGNLAMLRVFEKSGLDISMKREEGTVHVVMRLHPAIPAGPALSKKGEAIEGEESRGTHNTK